MKSLSCPDCGCWFELEDRSCPVACYECGGMLTASRLNILERVRQQAREVLSGVGKELCSKRCPGCEVAIMRIEGCSNMVCRCGVAFCWDCTRLVRGHPGRQSH